jgi:hypothetical protein
MINEPSNMTSENVNVTLHPPFAKVWRGKKSCSSPKKVFAKKEEETDRLPFRV